MKLVLDTHILLWAAMNSPRLSSRTIDILNNADNEFFFSSASLWEIIIKKGLDRKDFAVDPHVLRRGLLDNGYNELPISSEHVMAIDTLPNIHKDPFDRILIAQATVEGITLLTSDSALSRYPGPILLA